MTPIFYHPDQEVTHDFISTLKVPEFVRQADRRCRMAESISPAEITRAHDLGYVRDVVDLKIPDGFGKKHADMVKYAVGSVANMLSAVHHVLGSKDPVACSATQGFHHAHYAENYGYCTFNGLMVAASVALSEYGLHRVLIIDGDAHLGDGTEDIIRELDCANRVINVDRRDIVPANLDGVLGWRTFVSELISKHKPGIILYQAGADAWEKDPYGAGYLTGLGLMQRDRGVFQAARDAGVPLVWNLAGGYSDPMQSVIDLHLNTLNMSDTVYYGTTAS